VTNSCLKKKIMSGSNPKENLPIRMVVIILVFIIVFLVGSFMLVASVLWVTSPLWKTVLNIFGAFLAVSVAATFLYRTTLRAHDDAVRKRELRELLDEKVEEIIEGRFLYGLSEFHQKIDFAKLFDDLKKGDELWWLDTYAPGQKLWIEHMRKAIHRGARIRILALNPSCPNADCRAEEIGGLYSLTFKSDLKSFIHDLSIYTKEKSSEGGFLKLRKYSDLTCIPIYLVCRDNKPVFAYTSFFLGMPTAADFLHMSWRPAEHSLLGHFFDYISKKWDRNGPDIAPLKRH
jgi:hypothetical protein